MKSIQKKKSLCFIMTLFVLLMFVVPLVGFAQEEIEYTPLETLPFINDGDNTLSGYLEGIFKFLLAISILFTVVMVTWGGILYITTDAIGGKADGKAKITQALLGLLLALVSWLILNTINPDLLNLDLNPGESADQGEVAANSNGGS